MFARWHRSLVTSASRSQQRKRRLDVEPLESRVLLAVFTVDTTDDAVAEDGNVSLREAIMAANTNSAVNADVGAGDVTGDTITFDSTVFDPANSATIALSDSSGFGDFEITDDLVIDGVTGPVSVTLDGNNLNRIFDINSGSNGPVRLNGLTLINGNGTDFGTTPGSDGLGGAVYISSDENVTLNSVDLQGNTALLGGGGLYSTGSSVRINDGTFAGNAAPGTLGSGGGILSVGGSLLITESNFSANFAVVSGGGIAVRASSEGANTVTLGDVAFDSNDGGIRGGGLSMSGPATKLFAFGGAFRSNQAEEGGGLFNDVGSTVTINSTVFTQNDATGNSNGQGGGGIFNDGGTLNLHNVSVSQNSASGTLGRGGGLLTDGGDVTIRNSDFVSNSAQVAGGGLEVTDVGGSAAQTTLTNTTVSNNFAGINGGGLHVSAASGLVNEVNVNGGSVIGNTAGQEGGGLWNSATGDMTIDGTLITGNTALVANAANDAQGGGGVFNNGGSLSITNATITNNQVAGDTDAGADDGGGGIFNDGRNTSGASVNVSKTTISGNSVLSTSLNGGGLLSIGTSGNGAHLTIDSSTVAGNSAARAGGGIETNNATLTVTNATISGNSAGVNGGGIHATGADETIVAGGTIEDNTANQEGGGLWNSATASMTIINGATIDGNTALIANAANDAQGGGGVFNNGGTLLIANSTITNNEVSGNSAGADDGGGGVFNDGRNTTGATVSIINTTISGHSLLSTSLNGGGILNIGAAPSSGDPTTDLTITDSTISGNTAARAGGGIETNNASLTLIDTTLSGNSAGVNGGGLHTTGADVTTLSGGSVTGNTAGQEGGGLWNSAGGNMSINGTTILDNTALAGNASDAQGGGGVFNNGGMITISNAAIRSNVVIGDLDPTDGGGGVFNDGRNTAGATVNISNTSIVGNSAVDTGTATIGARGGGLLNIGSTSVGIANTNLTIADSIITGNTANQAGGGIETNAGTLTLRDSTVSGNSVGVNGGGIHVQAADVTTVTGGMINGNTAGQEGGGLWNSATGNMTIDGTNIVGNTALGGNSVDAQGGGGLFNNGGTVSVSNATIGSNVVLGDLDSTDGGGGIFNDGRNTAGASISLTNTTIINNDVINTGTAPLAGRGGGILNIADNSNSADISITGGTISGNSAAQAGGAIENRVLDSNTMGMASASINLDGVTLDSNETENNGGALHQGGTSGTLAVSAVESTFSNNKAGNEGGGLWNENNPGATISLTRSTVSGNASPNGGGLFANNDGTPGTLAIINSTVSGNAASNGGGLDLEGGAVAIDHSTITNNFGGNVGGGINVDSGTSLSIASSIIGNNQSAIGPDVAGNIGSADFSLISDTSGTTIGNANNLLLNIDPLLGALGDNGGPTFTHLPLEGSPVINAGDPSFTPPPDTDQRGEDRVRDGRLDMGSVEVGARTKFLVTGSGPGIVAEVKVFDASTGALVDTILPFGGFTGGVSVATGDINNDDVPDLFVAAGPGGGPHVKVFDGSNGTLLRSFFAYGSTFSGGVFVAAGDVNGDGFADIITGAGAGGGPHVQVFSGVDSSPLRSFFAYAPNFSGGVRVAAGDVNGDGFADIITGAGAGGGPHVQVFSGQDQSVLRSFFAYDSAFSGGVFVSAGDVNGDGFADIVTGAGAGGGPHVKVFNGAGTAVLHSFFAFGASFSGGVRVGSVDGSDGNPDLLVAPGAGAAPEVRIFDGGSGAQLDDFLAFNQTFTGGVFVAGSVASSQGGSPLHAPGEVDGSSARNLATADVEATRAAVLARFAGAGLDDASLSFLGTVDVRVADLSGSLLGLAGTGAVYIDSNAAGYGWYVDPDASTDDEFAAGGAGVGGRMDLLTALGHEFAHLLGLEDIDAAIDDLMADTLRPGHRAADYAALVDRLLEDDE